MSIRSDSEEYIQAILEQDRIWSAYAIADLDPQHKPHTVWFAKADAVILTYQGFSPPVLFSFGQLESLEFLFQQVPHCEYTFTLQSDSRRLVESRLQVSIEDEMWRMSLERDKFDPVPEPRVSELNHENLDEMLRLFADHPDRPDSFSPVQLDQGVYFGYWMDGELISVAGTHVLSHELSVAAVGNVFTRSDQRNKGYGTKVNSAVTKKLMDRGVKTIVLNVSTANHAAIRSYTRIGFEPYCKYYEGQGTLVA